MELIIFKRCIRKRWAIRCNKTRNLFRVRNKRYNCYKYKNKQEYDYTDEYGLEHTSTYNGKAGLQLGFIDKLVLGIKTGDLKLAFSSEITKDSKILMNRNIIKRAKQVMPYLIYDENHIQ